jgi:hypothetical protein
MFGSHFYNATLRRIVSVFGTLFNNISVVTKDQSGKVVRVTRVPLSYGPKQKFLARIDEQPDPDTGTKVAIKLPRMSFEIVSLTYDVTTKIGSFTQFSAPDSADSTVKRQVRSGAPYRVGIQLSILAKNQDDALQILEQVLPYFQPEYTVAIRDVDGVGTTNDVPIVLSSVSLSDDYEGDFMSRRAIIYTLDFELRARFYGQISKKKVIKESIVNYNIDNPTNTIQQYSARVDPLTANEEDSYDIIESITFLDQTNSYEVKFVGGSGNYTVGESVLGSTSGTTAKVRSWNPSTLTLVLVGSDSVFVVGEDITGTSSNTTLTSSSITPVFA